jgi:glutamine phosphoribosylpyrophosphate amidotransferase
MCGVIGVHLSNPTATDLGIVRELFSQSMIRGKHATGVTYFNGEQLVTDKAPVPVNEFFETRNVIDWLYDDDYYDHKCLTLIGHIRYSTSDLRYNQPFDGRTDEGQVAIAHNGVISQEPHSEWEFETETMNDSEMILRSIENGVHPLEKFADRSMAVTQLTTLRRQNEDGTEGSVFPMLEGYRNHERPLWRSKRKNGVLFASTADILGRSGVAMSLRCEPFTVYSNGGQSRRWHPNYLQTKEPIDLQL